MFSKLRAYIKLPRCWKICLIILIIIAGLIIYSSIIKQPDRFQNVQLPAYQPYSTAGLMNLPTSISGIAINSDSTKLAVSPSSPDTAIRIYNLETQSVFLATMMVPTQRLVFSNSDPTVLYLLSATPITLMVIKLNYETQGYTILKTISTGTLNLIPISYDSKYLLYYTGSTSSVNMMSTLDYSTTPFKFSNPSTYILSKDNNYLFISSTSITAADKSVLIQNPTSLATRYPDILNKAVLRAVFSYDSKYILVSCAIDINYYIQKYNVLDLINSNATPPVYSITMPMYSSYIDINNSDTIFITTTLTSSDILLYDFITGNPLSTLNMPTCTGASTPFIASYTRDNYFLYAACKTEIKLWSNPEIKKQITTTTQPATTTTQPATTTTQPATTTTKPTTTSPATTTTLPATTTTLPATTTTLPATTTTLPATTTSNPTTTSPATTQKVLLSNNNIQHPATTQQASVILFTPTTTNPNNSKSEATSPAASSRARTGLVLI